MRATEVGQSPVPLWEIRAKKARKKRCGKARTQGSSHICATIEQMRRQAFGKGMSSYTKGKDLERVERKSLSPK